MLRFRPELERRFICNERRGRHHILGGYDIEIAGAIL